MRKLINGNKVVDIKNIELFELAAEGMAIQSTTVSNTSDGLEGNVNAALIKRYLKQYDLFYKSMPYPLYAIGRDIKYAILGNFIASLSKSDVNMWVKNGLHIKLDKDTGMTITLVNNTWSIEYVKNYIPTDISLEKYSEDVGYREYLWILDKILHKESTSSFYKEFMPEFVDACLNQPMVIKWELENMLTFGVIPNRINLKTNCILDYSENKEYTLDIYSTGSVETDEKMAVWSLSGDKLETGQKYKSIKTYDFDVYSKDIDSNMKLEKVSLTGLRNLFMELCGVKSANDYTSFPEYEGIISDRNLVFTIGKRLFVAKSNRLCQSKYIANSAEIYNVEKGKVYFVKSKKVNDNIVKETLYSYSINDEALKVCKILYNY